MTVLLLADNNLTNILPEAVANLTSVRVLDLSRNNFTSIPVAILSMKNLKHLNLSSNYIRTLVNNSILGGLEELRELDISYLPLRVFEVRSFFFFKTHIVYLSCNHPPSIYSAFEKSEVSQLLPLASFVITKICQM